MKKLSLLFLALLALGSFFQSCSDQKTYAEMLEDERKAIREFIKKHNIKTITEEEFEKDTITNVSENEYVLLSGGVYLQIVNRGQGDTVRNRDEVLLRMAEYNILSEIDNSVSSDTLSNIDWPQAGAVDAFYYTPNSSSILFHQGLIRAAYSQSVGTLDVPRGIIDIIPYIKDKAYVKLIVPSKKGHSGANSMYSISPMYYDIHKIQIR